MKTHYEVASEKATDVFWLHADIDENPDLVRDFSIMGVPTLKAYKDGELVEEVLRLGRKLPREVKPDRLWPVFLEDRQ